MERALNASAMSLPRQVIPGSFYKLTRRTTQRQYLMRPDEVTNNTFTYCLAVAAQRYGIEVILPVAMSNHHHTDIFDRHGFVIEFMEHFHKLFAKAQNAHRDREENLWSSEAPSLVRIAEPERVIDALVYTAMNPVKDDLVERATDWPGVSGVNALLEGTPMYATRPEHYFRANGPMPEVVTLELTIPPELGDPETIRAEVRRRVEEEQNRYVELRKERRRTVLGRLAILAQDWRASPTTEETRGTLNPRFAAKTLWACVKALANARAFVAAYRSARVRWLAGFDVKFPPGTYWLRRFAGVQVAALQS